MKELYKVFDFLTDEYVEYIKTYYFFHPSVKGTVGGDHLVEHKKIRNNQIVWFDDSDRWADWVKFLQGFDPLIEWIQTPQISHYGPDEYYDWHIDASPTRRTHKRHLTLTVEIQSAEGARFEIKDRDIGPMKPGQAVVFPSVDLHRATAPTIGNRMSLTIWGMALTKKVQH